MPLTGTAPTLSAAFRVALLGNTAIQAIDGPALTGLCDALASVVVSHITANALVAPTLLVAPPGGGPVTGTGTIT